MEQQKKFPLRLEDIEEFTQLRLPSREEITDEIRAGVRKLDEKTELEPFLRDLLPDETNTPHTSTEIADILTTHVTYQGKPCLAAFINKGRSFPKVKADHIAAQTLKLMRIPHLNLAVLVAVGDIQDEPKVAFIDMANQLNAEYLVIDVTDAARLFIAAHKICPNDGTPFIEGRCEKCGSRASDPIELTIKRYEEPWYIKLPSADEDISNLFAKQYKVHILTDPHYPPHVLREVVKRATWEYRHSTFYRNAQVEERFGQKEADAIFLYVYLRMDDFPTVNWVCRTSWIRPGLAVPEVAMPQTMGGEWLGEIQIDWRADYEQMRKFWAQHTAKKDVWTQSVEKILPLVETLTRKVAQFWEEYKQERIDSGVLQQELEQLDKTASALYQEAGAQLPPAECLDCDTPFQGVMNAFSQIFLPFNSQTKARWTWERKLQILQEALLRYEEEKEAFRYEWKKIGKHKTPI